MKKVLGIFLILVMVMVLTASAEIFFTPAHKSNFLQPVNLMNILRWTGLYGIMAIGVAFVIITGGIDLSVGSIVGLSGTLLPFFLVSLKKPIGVTESLLIIAAITLGIGLLHGFLVTKVKLQPFVVTLCGLFFYRGIARYVTEDSSQGFGIGFKGLKYLANGRPFSLPVPGIGTVSIPMPFILLVIIAIIAALFLNRTIWGRYLLALGRNETAAKFSGINTDRMIMIAYVISAMLAGFSGILLALDTNSVQPSQHGNAFELYAIAGAVLGGCSLRGGEGSILGVILGVAIVRVLLNAINILGISTQLEFAVIGFVILAGVMADETIKRIAARRRAARRV